MGALTISESLVLVAGMAVVTYIPRLLPFLVRSTRPYPPKVKQFLSYLPYAILGALIFPGVLSSTGELVTAVAGLAAALVLAWRGAHLLWVVSGAIGAAALMAVFVG